MKKSMEKLVQLAQKGDQEAIAALYEQTYSSVYQSVRAVIKDEDEALDIVQDSYIKGFKSLNKLGDPQKYQAWMKTIAANQARDFLRKKRPALFSERIDEDGEEIDLRRQDDCLEHMPEEVIDRQETTRLMNDILGTLSEEQRLAIVMFYYEERTVREIAESLSCSENTVKSRLNYGRKKIEAEVRALEKKGTKLYSLAPMPFFIWVLRMAKEQGLTLAMDGVDAVVATGTVAAGTAAAGEAAGATAAGEATATAGSAAYGNAVTGTAAKAATSTAGKTLATKAIAGALAVTVAAGAGAVAVNNISREKENQAAHVVYEEFLGRYQDAFEMDAESFRIDYNRFWNEIGEDILEQNPNIDKMTINDWYLEYTTGNNFEDGVFLPNTVFEPNMSSLLLLEKKLTDEDIRFAYYDINSDGVDEVFVAKFYRDELQEHDITVYTVEDGVLCRGKVHCMFDGDSRMWGFTGVEIAEYVDPGVVYIRMGMDYFSDLPDIEKPECDWELLYGSNGDESLSVTEYDITVELETSSAENIEMEILKGLEGTYRYEVDMKDMLGIVGGREYMMFHNFTITVTDDEIIIEDIGEPQKSLENQTEFIDDMLADGIMILPEQKEKLHYDNWGIMRINRASIQFIEPHKITFDSANFEGPTAPVGKINTIDYGKERIILAYHGMDPENGLYVCSKYGDMAWSDFAYFGGLWFSNNETFPPK